LLRGHYRQKRPLNPSRRGCRRKPPTIDLPVGVTGACGPPWRPAASSSGGILARNRVTPASLVAGRHRDPLPSGSCLAASASPAGGDRLCRRRQYLGPVAPPRRGPPGALAACVPSLRSSLSFPVTRYRSGPPGATTSRPTSHDHSLLASSTARRGMWRRRRRAGPGGLGSCADARMTASALACRWGGGVGAASKRALNHVMDVRQSTKELMAEAQLAPLASRFCPLGARVASAAGTTRVRVVPDCSLSPSFARCSRTTVEPCSPAALPLVRQAVLRRRSTRAFSLNVDTTKHSAIGGGRRAPAPPNSPAFAGRPSVNLTLPALWLFFLIRPSPSWDAAPLLQFWALRA